MGNMNVPTWEEFKRFAELKIYSNLAGDKKDYFEDVLQECYISYEEAKETYDSSQGKSFAGWFMSYYFYNAMNRAIYGGRTERIIADPVNNADSLERPVGDDDLADITLGDTIIDETAAKELNRGTDIEFWSHVKWLIIEGAEKAGEQQTRIILTMLHNDCGIKEAQELLNDQDVPYWKYQSLYKSACDSIRRHITTHVKKLQGTSAIEEVISFKGTGLHTYKEQKFTSSVEFMAIKRADNGSLARDLGQIISQGLK